MNNHNKFQYVIARGGRQEIGYSVSQLSPPKQSLVASIIAERLQRRWFNSLLTQLTCISPPRNDIIMVNRLFWFLLCKSRTVYSIIKEATFSSITGCCPRKTELPSNSCLWSMGDRANQSFSCICPLLP